MDKSDEYKFFAEATQNLSDRRQSATEVYLGVNTAIFALIAFLLKDAGLQGHMQGLLTIPLFAVGGFACFSWYKVIARYKSLIAWRYEQLIEMEKNMPNIHGMFTKEWRQFFAPGECHEQLGFSSLEEWLPKILLILYLVYGVGFVIWKLVGN
jgi:hypothetical protein